MSEKKMPIIDEEVVVSESLDVNFEDGDDAASSIIVACYVKASDEVE